MAAWAKGSKGGIITARKSKPKSRAGKPGTGRSPSHDAPDWYADAFGFNPFHESPPKRSKPNSGADWFGGFGMDAIDPFLSLIHISEPTRPY